MTSINIKSASVNQSMDVSNEKKPLKSSLHKTSHSVGAKKSTDPSSIIHATNVRFSASFLCKYILFFNIFTCFSSWKIEYEPDWFHWDVQ